MIVMGEMLLRAFGDVKSKVKSNSHFHVHKIKVTFALHKNLELLSSEFFTIFKGKQKTFSHELSKT
jgi:hypothetical protein